MQVNNETIKETEWTNIFNAEQVREPLNVEVGDCGANCQLAKEQKCICRCGGKNHGAALRQNVKSLDEFEEDPGEEPSKPFEDPAEN